MTKLQSQLREREAMKFEPAVEERLSCHELAIQRCKAAIRAYDLTAEVYTSEQALAGIIADIMHYCNHYTVDFQNLIHEAELYIAEDESVDADLTRGNYND